jgi:surface protein
MKNLSKRILEAINSGVRMGLSLDDFDDIDDKLPTLKKDIKSESRNVIKEYE